MSFTWQNGRQLQGITKGTNNYSYTYDADGLRTSKTVNGVTTSYYTIEGTLLAESTGTDTIRYLQDNNGKHYGFIYNGTMYYYTFNLQGDVTGILDSTGVKVVEYTYDIWGKVLSVTGTLADTIGQINPIRYRGYYYDAETGFYYLQSRYYDPEVGRFLNADGYVSTGIGLLGYNMFAYCNNNPVIFLDSNGTRPIVGASLKNESDDDRDLSFSYMKELYAKPSTKTSPTRISPEGLSFIATFESFSSTVYDDGYGNLTIGYGHLIQPGENFSVITRDYALLLLSQDVYYAEQRVITYLRENSIAWDQKQFDALVSLSFNSGYNVTYVIDSLIAGENPYTAFSQIIYSGGQKSLGLYRRRMDEADIYLWGAYERTERSW